MSDFYRRSSKTGRERATPGGNDSEKARGDAPPEGRTNTYPCWGLLIVVQMSPLIMAIQVDTTHFERPLVENTPIIYVCSEQTPAVLERGCYDFSPGSCTPGIDAGQKPGLGCTDQKASTPVPSPPTKPQKGFFKVVLQWPIYQV